MKKKVERNIRIVIKVNPSVSKELDAFSKMMSIPKSTLVSIVMIDGFRQYTKGRIDEYKLYSPAPRMLKKAKSNCSIKFSIAEDIYGEINKLINELNKRKDVRINMQSLFLGFWLWYRKFVFSNLSVHITNLSSREREIECAVGNFFKNKAIDYGVPVSNLQSFYLAQLLDEILSKEAEFTGYEMKEDTRLFLDPLVIE